MKQTPNMTSIHAGGSDGTDIYLLTSTPSMPPLTITNQPKHPPPAGAGLGGRGPRVGEGDPEHAARDAVVPGEAGAGGLDRGGVWCVRVCAWTDGRTDGRTHASHVCVCVGVCLGLGLWWMSLTRRSESCVRHVFFLGGFRVCCCVVDQEEEV